MLSQAQEAAGFQTGVWLPVVLRDELCLSPALRKSTSVFGVGGEEEVRETNTLQA